MRQFDLWAGLIVLFALPSAFAQSTLSAQCDARALPKGSTAADYLPPRLRDSVPVEPARTDIGSQVAKLTMRSAIPIRSNDERIAKALIVQAHVLSWWNTDLTEQEAYGWSLHNYRERGVHDGIVGPLLELIDRSMMLGKREIAVVANAGIAFVNPDIATTLCKGLQLPTSLPASAFGGTSPESIAAATPAYKQGIKQLLDGIPARNKGPGYAPSSIASQSHSQSVLMYGFGSEWDASVGQSANARASPDAQQNNSSRRSGPLSKDDIQTCHQSCSAESERVGNKIMESYFGFSNAYQRLARDPDPIVARRVVNLVTEWKQASKAEDRAYVQCSEKCLGEIRKQREADAKRKADEDKEHIAASKQNDKKKDEKEKKDDKSSGATKPSTSPSQQPSESTRTRGKEAMGSESAATSLGECIKVPQDDSKTYATCKKIYGSTLDLIRAIDRGCLAARCPGRNDDSMAKRQSSGGNSDSLRSVARDITQFSDQFANLSPQYKDKLVALAQTADVRSSLPGSVTKMIGDVRCSEPTSQRAAGCQGELETLIRRTCGSEQNCNRQEVRHLTATKGIALNDRAGQLDLLSREFAQRINTYNGQIRALQTSDRTMLERLIKSPALRESLSAQQIRSIEAELNR